MKKSVLMLIIAVLLLSACSKQKDQSIVLKKDTPTYQLAEKIAAKIPYLDPEANNVLAEGTDLKVTTGTVVKKMFLILGNKSEGLESVPENRLRDIVGYNLENVIEEILLLNQIEKTHIRVDKSKVDSAMQVQYFQAGGEEQFRKQLEENKIPYDEIVQDVKNRLFINRYFNQKYSQDINPTEEEIVDLYNQDIAASVRHILFLTQGKTDQEKEEIRKKAAEVLSMARAGKDFSKLAKKYSEDPGSKDKGGLYKNFGRGYMVKPFDEASFNLPVGSISDLVETQYGYHIIKVEDRIKETRPLTEVRELLIKNLKDQKRQILYNSHIKDLKEEAKIQIAPF